MNKTILTTCIYQYMHIIAIISQQEDRDNIFWVNSHPGPAFLDGQIRVISIRIRIPAYMLKHIGPTCNFNNVLQRCAHGLQDLRDIRQRHSRLRLAPVHHRIRILYFFGAGTIGPIINNTRGSFLICMNFRIDLLSCISIQFTGSLLRIEISG